MKISYEWLKNYIESELTIDEILTILTDIGLEVDGIEKTEAVRGGLDGVVVGEVLTCESHPDSDHLHVTTVAIGREEPLNIVCGAKNVAKGQKVLVATIGAVLYPAGEEEGFKIKRSKIRGVESLGMICAEDELGVGTSHDGIMVLAPDAVSGTPAAEYLNLRGDYVIEIGLTPNRADAMSHYGIARDLTAYLKSKDKPVKLSLPDIAGYAADNKSHSINIRVENGEAAPRYAGVTISGVKIAQSPEWLQTNLRALGINPKNNVVDVTNFVLHELGQPLHSFDADKIEGSEVVVRTCPEGTKFKTLDGVERSLSDRDIMICNAHTPMCIAGVMGGEESGVTESTTNIFLESAYFNPVWIRKSARRHGINSDASFRFERGIDPNITIFALKRAALLIKELSGGKITSDITDIISVPEITEPFRFNISYARINTLTGKEIPEATVKKILESLEVRIESEIDGVLSVAVPAYRVDVRRDADLIEDILRIYGYNNIETPSHVNSTLAFDRRPGKEQISEIVSEYLTSNGFTEIMSNSLTKGSYYEELTTYPSATSVKILNPLSTDLNVMRQTLFFGVMEAIELNTNHRNSNLKVYEFGNVYSFNSAKVEDGGLAPYSENQRLAIAVTGLDTTASWSRKAEAVTFFTLRGIAENILHRFGIDIYKLKSDTVSNDIYSEGLSIILNGKTLFTLGIVASKMIKQFGLKSDVFYLEMDFDLFVKSTRKHTVRAEDISRFPEVRRDLALLVDKDVTFARLREIAFAAEKKLLCDVTLFDVYEGDKLPEGKKSYALGFVLRDIERTLTDQIIDKAMNNLIIQFERQANASVRS